MRIFIAYSYQERDRWIEDLIFPLITSFDSTPVHGKDIQGARLSDEVKDRISRCQALLAFVTRRGNDSVDGRYFTHRWVTDELAFASQLGKAVVEVREAGVDPQDGIAGDRVRIKFEGTDRLEVLLQLTGTLARWHRQMRRVHLIPQKSIVRDGQLMEVGAEWLRGQMNRPGFRCQYQILDGDYESSPVDAEVRSIEGRLYLSAGHLSSGSRLRLHITTSEGVFVSGFENVDDVNLPIALAPSEDRFADPRPRGLETVLRGE